MILYKYSHYYITVHADAVCLGAACLVLSGTSTIPLQVLAMLLFSSSLKKDLTGSID